MIPWEGFTQLFLLFSAGVTGAVFLLKYMATKWIDSTFEVKMKELEHQYALIEQRESVKYAKMYEARWKALEILPFHLRSIKSATQYSTMFILAGHPAERKTGREMATELPAACEYLTTFVDNHGTNFGEEFERKCKTLMEASWGLYQFLRDATEDLEAEIDKELIKKTRDEIFALVEDLTKEIRKHKGSEIV